MLSLKYRYCLTVALCQIVICVDKHFTGVCVLLTFVQWFARFRGVVVGSYSPIHFTWIAKLHFGRTMKLVGWLVDWSLTAL